MKQTKSYYLSGEVIQAIHKKAVEDRRKDSDWLDFYLYKQLVKDFSKPESKVERFKRPTFEEVRAYCLNRHNKVDPQQFIDFYESNGWMRGKTKIKDWKACVRTWEKNQKPKDDRSFMNAEFK
jgi:hypothetical protein